MEKVKVEELQEKKLQVEQAAGGTGSRWRSSRRKRKQVKQEAGGNI